MAEICWDNVLILQTSFLGDTVLTLPLIAEVRRRFPIKKLSVLCLPLSRELLRDHPAIDQIIVDDKRHSDRGWSGVRRKAGALRACGFTLALTPHKSLRSAMILAFAGIPNRIGFRESRGWFLFHHLAERDFTRHDVERNLSVLQALGVSVTECQRAIDFPVSPESQDAVNQTLKSLGIVEGKLIFGINPGSVWPTKRWAASGFAELVRSLRQKFDCQIMIFGAAEDKEVVEAVQNGSGGAAINLTGRIGLRELPAAISRCAVFVTNDSGPMHIAVGRRVPTVAIFCATTPALGFYPYTDNAIVVQKELSCRPCASHGGRRCPLGTEECIRQISSAKVLVAVEELLHSAHSRLASAVDTFQPRFMTV